MSATDAEVATQPALLNYLASAYMSRGVVRRAQQEFAGAVADYDRAIQVLEALLAALPHVVLGDYLKAIQNRMRLHLAQQQVRSVTTFNS